MRLIRSSNSGVFCSCLIVGAFIDGATIGRGNFVVDPGRNRLFCDAVISNGNEENNGEGGIGGRSKDNSLLSVNGIGGGRNVDGFDNDND